MKNKYFNELIKEVESFEKFWHKKYFQVNCRGKRIYKNFNDYYQKVQDTKKEETENMMDELEDIQDKLDRIEKKLEEDPGKKYSSFSSDAEKKELYGKPDFLKY